MPSFDIVFVLPYLFSDHPSFPEGLLRRALESEGFSIGIIEQPRWQQADDFKRCGRPGLFFCIIPGPLDSIVLNYTASGKRRKEDLYQPGDDPYFPGSKPSVSSRIRPDRTITVFANRIREALPDARIVIGGLEASMRKYAHYDFQQRKIRRSILLDSRADLLVTGRGEKQLLQAAHLAARGEDIRELRLPGSAAVVRELPEACELLPAAEAVAAEPELLLEAELKAADAAGRGVSSAQPHGNRFVLVQPSAGYVKEDLDRFYSLPFTREHLSGQKFTSALSMNLFSVTSHRGCGGGCSFCSITAHEGRRITSRSEESILREIRGFSKHSSWKGVVSDIGGPSAEMYGMDCSNSCRRASCMHPGVCGNFGNAGRYRELLKAARALPDVKNVFIGSGIRYESLLNDPALLEDVLRYHTGRFLRVAPEHTEDGVLKLMRKPAFNRFTEFLQLYRSVNKKLRRPVALECYYIIGSPGETDRDVLSMRERLRASGLRAKDVQLFTPTPGTLATAMWVAEKDPEGNPIYVEKDIRKLEERKSLLTGNGNGRNRNKRV